MQLTRERRICAASPALLIDSLAAELGRLAGDMITLDVTKRDALIFSGDHAEYQKPQWKYIVVEVGDERNGRRDVAERRNESDASA